MIVNFCFGNVPVTYFSNVPVTYFGNVPVTYFGNVPVSYYQKAMGLQCPKNESVNALLKYRLPYNFQSLIKE